MRVRLILPVAIAALAALLWAHNVPTSPTHKDRAAIAKMMHGRDVPSSTASYEAEVALIAAVQHAVLAASPVEKGIPTGQTREPADLLRAGKGLCFDRSRSIEKALEALGFETRHVAVFESLKAALWPRVSSHALSEVRTSRGWMLVDSVTPWLGIDVNGEPVSTARLSQAELRNPIPDEIAIMRGDFLYFYGLFSRHGQFYPPFTPFPDVNWRQAVANVF